MGHFRDVKGILHPVLTILATLFSAVNRNAAAEHDPAAHGAEDSDKGQYTLKKA